MPLALLHKAGHTMRATILSLIVVALSLRSAHSQNLLVNGSFEAGNFGFTSTYRYSPADMNEGSYSVVADPHDTP
jgi:hypothetical protein